MKKLNRKGFTLVELLAVIVILAIVVGIALPAVTNTMNSSKKKGFETAVANAATYLQKQYDTYVVAPGTEDDEFETVYKKITTKGTGVALTDTDVVNLGFKTKNVSEVYVCLTENGRFVVAVTKEK